jgi:hypothetical protein
MRYVFGDCTLDTERYELAMTVATDQGFPQQLAQAMSLRG